MAATTLERAAHQVSDRAIRQSSVRPKEVSRTRASDERKREPLRYYVPTDTCGVLEGSRIGVSWLMREALVTATEPLIILPSSAFAVRDRHLAAATRLFRWETALSFKAASAEGWDGGPTLLVSPEARVLGWFDRSDQVTRLCVVQGSRNDAMAWARAHRPEDLTTGRPFEYGVEVDAVVMAALDSLARARTWSGLTSAADIAVTVDTLRLLDRSGHTFTPQDLEAWAIRARWSPSAARRLGGYAEKIRDGQFIPLRSLAKPPRGSLARWRIAARLASPLEPRSESAVE